MEKPGVVERLREQIKKLQITLSLKDMQLDDARVALEAFQGYDGDEDLWAILKRDRDVYCLRAVHAEEVAHWAQAVLTSLNCGDVAKESKLHLKLREVMIDYRDKLAALPK